ncbi:GTPase-associated system all-helical protein GASH [Bradyrhizobium sp. TZ2]
MNESQIRLMGETMLSEIGDWYRIIDPVLNDDRLSQRKETASALADSWQDADQGTLLAIVSLVNELTSANKNLSNRALAPTIDAIILNQPSFDRKADIAANDIRICAAVALSEILHRAKLQTGSGTTVVKAAACVVSSLRFRNWSCPRAVSDQLQLLLSAAQELLRHADMRRRRRAKEPLLELDEVPADFSKAKEEYEAAFAVLEEEILKDREELQALWWLFGGYSVLRSEKYSDIKIGVGLLAGHELSTILSPPPTVGMAALAARMVRSALGANQSIALAKLFEKSPLIW